MRTSVTLSAWTCLGICILSGASLRAEPPASPDPKPRPAAGTVVLEPPLTTKVHILLIFDTNADELKPVLAINKDKLQGVIKDDLDPDKVDLAVFEGADVTADNILKYYGGLTVAATESVFCYYAGHGGYDDNGGLFFDLKAKGSGSLVRSKLLDAMKAKNGRLTALVTDCCANKSTIKPTFADVGAPAPVIGDLKKPSYWIKALLLRNTGVVDINGCDSKTKQRSFAIVGKGVDKGGLFTDNLVSIWSWELPSTADVKAVTWKAFYDKVKEMTQNDYTSLLKSDPDAASDPAIKAQPDQTPEALQLQAAPDEVRIAGAAPAPGGGWRLGLRVKNNNGDGVRVLEVVPRSAAQKAGFEVGDVLTVIDGRSIKSEDDYAGSIDGCTTGHIKVVVRDVRTKKESPPVDVPLDPK